MRDKIKSQDYFVNKYNSENKRIMKFREALIQLDESNKKGIRIGKIHLSNLFLECIKLTYSMGGSLDTLYEYYLEYLKYYQDVCTPDDSMYDIIDILSIGVLFKNKKEQFITYLNEIVLKFESDDGLIICFMNYLENREITYQKSKIEYFNEFLENDKKEFILENGLTRWYEKHNDAYWYDSHKAKHDTYCGYWCFEIAAIARIFNINDGQFKLNKYYPTDLAEFNR